MDGCERIARRGTAAVPAAACAREPHRVLRVLGTRIGGSAPKPCASSGRRDGHHRCERPTPRRLLRGRRPDSAARSSCFHRRRWHRVVHNVHRRRASGDDGPLSAAGALPFLGIPLGDLENACVGLEHLWGAQGESLHERLIAAEAVADRIEILETFLLHRATVHDFGRHRGVCGRAARVRGEPVDARVACR